MLQQFNKLADNTWLNALTPTDIKHDKVPITAILENSCYYPASGMDGEIIRIAAGNVFSFVYVDYFISKQNFLDKITKPEALRGYRIVAGRDVSENELMDGAKNYPVPTNIQQFFNNSQQRMMRSNESPFAYWAIFDSIEECSHAPRISLLFIHADGAATYQKLYWGHDTAPSIVNLHQPGHGFGGNWTNFFNENEPLAQLVLHHPTGKLPKAIACGGMGEHYDYRDYCWKNSFNIEVPSDIEHHVNHLFFTHKNSNL